jgi:hypothetical protein
VQIIESGSDSVQIECSQCGKIGLLQKITNRYYRVRHTVKRPYHSIDLERECYNRDFTYCRVPTGWAEEQINNEKLREEEYLRKLLNGES